MKRAFSLGVAALVLTGFSFTALSAQQDEALRKKYEEKLQKEFVKKVAWKQTLDEAMSEAKAKKSLIMGYFTRSYSP